MKSGLEGRNNKLHRILLMPQLDDVSMKSGLEGRNNPWWRMSPCSWAGLNEVRPRRPEQCR